MILKLMLGDLQMECGEVIVEICGSVVDQPTGPVVVIDLIDQSGRLRILRS
jgi:hypothetical protein